MQWFFFQMPVEKIDIEEFLERSSSLPVLDVRSPGEYLHAHLPGACSLPIFSDEERKAIGTAYKQQGRDIAVNIGIDSFSKEMKSIPGKALELFKNSGFAGNPSFLVHCWRGGMRSEAIAWLLSLYGYKVFLLKGGYKSFRRWALAQFEKKYSLALIGGFTGSGKTELLEAMNATGFKTIDLEGLAHHKGSAFGALGMEKQPTQEMFENKLALQLAQKSSGPTPEKIWLEDESRHIGIVHIPEPFWNQMRTSDLYFLEIPSAERLDFITRHYGCFPVEELAACVLKIQKRLGGLETQRALAHLQKGEIRDCFAILLTYYDKFYHQSLQNREDLSKLLHKVPCESVTIDNAKRLNYPSHQHRQ